MPNFDDEEELFSSYENINTYNRTSDKSADKITKNINDNKSKFVKEPGVGSKVN